MKIEKNVPIPTPKRPRRDYSALDALRPGESVFFDNVYRGSLSAILDYRRVRDGKRFVARKESNGTRVWRLPDPEMAIGADSSLVRWEPPPALPGRQ